jgi:hypothetical protein
VPPLPASQAGQPIAYFRKGKQYITMFVGDGKNSGELVAPAIRTRTGREDAGPQGRGWVMKRPAMVMQRRVTRTRSSTTTLLKK